VSITKTSLLVFLISLFIVFSIGLSSHATSHSYNTNSQFLLQKALAQPAAIDSNASNTITPPPFNNIGEEGTDRDTLSHIKSSYGKSIPNWIDNASSHHNLDESATQIIAGIKPDYGTSIPYFSASIPFVASGVGLWSPLNAPFLASYQISAKLGQPEVFNVVNTTAFAN
jgi:hypothetical protein